MTVAPIPVPELDTVLARSSTEPVPDAPPTGSSGFGRLPELALGMAVGSAAVAGAFAAARYGHGWADQLFWLGQVVIYAAPAAFLLCRKRILAVEALGVALLMPVITYLVSQYYSPGQFRFLDEFDHVQTAQSILTTHHLFHASTVLPQSPQYPGLEIITTGIVSITHLSITTSGIIVAGAAHVLAGLALYFLIVEAVGRPRVAALAAVIYATGSHYQFFDSYFIYETVALPFLLLSLLATVRMMKSSGRTAVGWGVTAVALGAVTAVCHHVTSYALVGLLLAFLIAQPFLTPSARSRGLVPVFLAVAGMVAIWDLGIATATYGYFRPVVASLLPGHTAAAAPSAGVPVQRGSGVSGKPPSIDALVEYLGFALLFLLTGLGAWRGWRTRRSDTNGAPLGLAVASVSLVVAVGLRVAASNGSELSSRALTFVMIPVSFLAARTLVERTFRRHPPGHRNAEWDSIGFAVLSTVAVAVLAVGGIASGWPPSYARLPGPYRVSAWERSVDGHHLAVAGWFADNVPADQGVASDFSTEALISALGHQAEVQGIAGLFLPLTYSGAQGALARNDRVSFIAVDRRITQQLPATGYYFKDDPDFGHYTSPLPVRAITKFEQVPGVSRVYDDGTVVVYEIIGSAYLK